MKISLFDTKFSFRLMLHNILDFLQARLDIVRLIRGRSCTIQRTDSDTLLHIPDGVYAALLGSIHTDPNKFRHHIPQKDCLVAPICEYHLQPFLGQLLPEDAKYKICVPHIVRICSATLEEHPGQTWRHPQPCSLTCSRNSNEQIMKLTTSISPFIQVTSVAT